MYSIVHFQLGIPFGEGRRFHEFKLLWHVDITDYRRKGFSTSSLVHCWWFSMSAAKVSVFGLKCHCHGIQHMVPWKSNWSIQSITRLPLFALQYVLSLRLDFLMDRFSGSLELMPGQMIAKELIRHCFYSDCRYQGGNETPFSIVRHLALEVWSPEALPDYHKYNNFHSVKILNMQHWPVNEWNIKSAKVFVLTGFQMRPIRLKVPR